MELLYLLIELIVKCVVVFAGLMIVVAYLTWLERKVLGHIQVRMGPNRCGPYRVTPALFRCCQGLFQRRPHSGEGG